MAHSVASLSRLAERHWAEFLPEKAADLKKAGTFEMRAQQAAERAVAEIQALVRNGGRSRGDGTAGVHPAEARAEAGVTVATYPYRPW